MYLVTRGEVGSVQYMHDSWHAACLLDMATAPVVVLGLTTKDKDYLKLLTPVFVLVVLTWGRPGKPQHATNCNHGPWSDWLVNIRQSWHCLSGSESGLHSCTEVWSHSFTCPPNVQVRHCMCRAYQAVPKFIQVTNGLTYIDHIPLYTQAQGTSVIVQESKLFTCRPSALCTHTPTFIFKSYKQ